MERRLMFDRAYRNFRENMELLAFLCGVAFWWLLKLIVNLTLPLWIAPYVIWRRMRKENK